jgi:hypothetical protein
VEKISGHTWPEKNSRHLITLHDFPYKNIYSLENAHPFMTEHSKQPHSIPMGGKQKGNTHDDYNVCPDLCTTCICLLDMFNLSRDIPFCARNLCIPKLRGGKRSVITYWVATRSSSKHSALSWKGSFKIHIWISASLQNVAFAVLTAVVVFWDVPSCSLVNVYWHF